MKSSSRRIVLGLAALVLAAVLAATVYPASVLAGASTGDGVWKWQNPLPQGNSVNGAWFADAQSGWVVGDNGTIIHTADGGASWTGQTSNTTLELNAIYFVDEKHGWAVGGGFSTAIKYPPMPPTIVATSDGGATWHGQPLWVDDDTDYNLNLILNTDLYAVYFVDDQHGWTVGRTYTYTDHKYHGLLLSTDDGGKSWRREAASIIGGTELRDVYFTDTLHGWIVGEDILTTTDGGAHWTAQSGSARAMVFSDPTHGWLAGSGGALQKTTDGGVSWTPVALPTGQSLLDVFSSDADHAVVLASDGTVFRTDDGGVTWGSQSVGRSDVGISTMCFGDAAAGWIMGTQYCRSDNEPVSCYVRQTTDGGVTWAAPASYVTADLLDVSFVSRTEGWAVGADGTVMVTTDGGEHWTTQAPPVAAGLDDVDFVDAMTGWAVGDGGTIVATIDGGTTWHQQPSPASADLAAVDFVDAQHGWAAGASSVLTTNDGGLTWSAASVDGGDWTPDIESVSFVNAEHGWVAGTLPAKRSINGPKGCVYATEDGGATWTRQYVHDYLRLHSVWFTDARNGWVAGDQKVICQTRDGGKTWKQCDIVTEWADGTSMNSIMLIDRTHGWSVGTGGYILATSDGQHWVEENSGTTRELHGVSFVDEGHGWVVGDGGMILEDPGPLCRAPYKSVVRRGRMATIKCIVSDAASVRIRVKIVIRGRTGSRARQLILRNQRPNRVLKATFRCRLHRGTFHFYVYASDSAGNKAAVPAVNKLIVR